MCERPVFTRMDSPITARQWEESWARTMRAGVVDKWIHNSTRHLHGASARVWACHGKCDSHEETELLKNGWCRSMEFLLVE
jgi:hypothetical protein